MSIIFWLFDIFTRFLFRLVFFISKMSRLSEFEEINQKIDNIQIEIQEFTQKYKGNYEKMTVIF